jgi:hypothetical protein
MTLSLIPAISGLANDLEFPQDRVLPHALCEEWLATSAGVVENVVERIAHVLQVRAIVLHSAVASATIRGSR